MEILLKRQNIRTAKQIALIAMLSAVLTACGGGGSSSTTTVAPGVEDTVLSLATKVDSGTLTEEAFIASLPAAVL